jgi:poly-gamma-glutamate synthesis protein (capsule biosynthesis protein)
VPPAWEAAAREALAALDASGDAAWQWSVEVSADPGADTGGVAGTVSLVQAPGGLVVRQEPIALAVPFTTNWDYATRAEGDTILAGGHRLAEPIVWSTMEPRRKALRVEGLHPTDEGYPYQEVWSLAAQPGSETAAEEVAPYLVAAMAPEPVIHLVAVGDIMLDRSLGTALANGNLDHPFYFVAPLLQAADYTIGNLETALGNIGEPAAKRYPFRSPPESAESLARAGFDLVSLANNHAQDYGPEALLQGIDLLRAQDVATIGAGADDVAAHAPHIAEINGLSVAFLGYVNVPVEAVSNFDTASWTATTNAPGLAWADPARIRADVTAVRPEVDLVVVVLHSGYEYIEQPSEPQVAAAQAATEAGANLVIGHHAHILQGIQYHADGVIAYGLGNFAFEIDGPPETAVLNVWLDANGVRQLEVRPAFVQDGGQPRMAEPWESGPILERVNYLTLLLNPQPPPGAAD